MNNARQDALEKNISKLEEELMDTKILVASLRQTIEHLEDVVDYLRSAALADEHDATLEEQGLWLCADCTESMTAAQDEQNSAFWRSIGDSKRKNKKK